MEETASYPCPHCGYLHQKQAAQSYALQPGTILHGKYLIGSMLGQGGFGITYIGWDLALNRKVAIKEYFPSSYVSRDSEASTFLQWYSSPQSQEARNMGKDLFLKEARKMNRVDSIPQVVHVQELFEDNQTAYIVMNYIPGENLEKRVKRTGPLSWKQVQELLLPVAQVMQKVHDAGLVHRDLSPDNLMLQPDGSIKILDLGAAKDISLHSGASSMQVAKSGFSPMEQYVQKGNSGPWTDVYSLAATIYFALTGLIPPTAVDRLSKDTLRWDLPQLRKIPFPALRALQKAMAIHAKDRTQSMTAFAEDIRSTSAERNGRKVLIGVIAACLVLAVSLSSVFRGNSGPEPADPASVSAPGETGPRANTSQEVDITAPWGRNILTSTIIPEQYTYNAIQAPVFNSRIARYQIVSVTFLDSLKNAGANSWDVSQARDGSVQAWTKANGTVSAWIDSKNVESDAYDLYIAAEGGINGKYCAHLFEGFSNLNAIHFNDSFHTDYAESMENMFRGCTNLRSIDLRRLETGNVRSMEGMFAGCDAETLDVSNFDTSNVENMAYMFDSCGNLTSLDLRSFDTSKVTDMGDMFSMASALTDLNIRSFDTSNVADMSFMFSYSGLTSLDLTHFDTSAVTTISYMFSGCKALHTVDTTGWDTSGVIHMDGVFSDCKKLDTVAGILDWDTSKVEYHNRFMDEGTRIEGKPWENLFK